jgi:hypothetical protein
MDSSPFVVVCIVEVKIETKRSISEETARVLPLLCVSTVYSTLARFPPNRVLYTRVERGFLRYGSYSRYVSTL